MRIAISGYDSITCLGDAEETFEALCAGRTGVRPLRVDAERLGVDNAHEIADDFEGRRASRWLARVVESTVRRAGLSALETRVAVIVGTGLRELPDAEWWWAEGDEMSLADLHFATAIRSVLPGAVEILTVANACAASGYALGLGQDMLAAGEADAVVVAGCDSITESLLAVIGRGSPARSSALRPFDAGREGVLLGEGAAAVVIEPEDKLLARRGLASGYLHGVGLSCDAFHDTAPDPAGIAACMRESHTRAAMKPEEINLVLAHGTGTALNDPAEAAALTDVLGSTAGDQLTTAIKGAIGHTSGGSALMSLIVALQSMRSSLVPAVHGLEDPIPEAAPLRFVTGAPITAHSSVAQIDAFGFGGVNAVALVGAAR